MNERTIISGAGELYVEFCSKFYANEQGPRTMEEVRDYFFDCGFTSYENDGAAWLDAIPYDSEWIWEE